MQNKVAIILWLYHTDLAEEFIRLLDPHKDNIDIFLGLCKDHNNQNAEELFLSTFPNNLHIEYLDNGGTDILPTLKLLEKCLDYPIFFKLHSKTSNWGVHRHVNWRCVLLNDILFQDNFYETIRSLNMKHIGIVGSKVFTMRQNEYTNSQNILQLCSLLGIDYKNFSRKYFIGGNIFAAKTSIFKPLLYNQKIYDLLSNEVGNIKDDAGGTYVHSMERIFGYMAEYHNKLILGAPFKTKIILNHKTKPHRLHMVHLYNNDCYIQENPNIYGSIVRDDSAHIDILWKHVQTNQFQSYIKYKSFLINTNTHVNS